MEIMGVIGVMVNCALIGNQAIASVSWHSPGAGLSGPVHRLFPDMTSAQTVLLIIVLEHLMLLLKFLISAAIPDTPHHVAQVRGSHYSISLSWLWVRSWRGQSTEGARWRGSCLVSGWLISSLRSDDVTQFWFLTKFCPQSSCGRMDSKESMSPGVEVEDRGTQCDYDFRWRNEPLMSSHVLTANDAWN